MEIRQLQRVRRRRRGAALRPRRRAPAHGAVAALAAVIRRLEADARASRCCAARRAASSCLPAGEVLLERARAILAAVERGRGGRPRARPRGELGRLAIGFTGLDDLRAAAAPRQGAARASCRASQLDLRGEMLTPAQVEGLLDGTLDVGAAAPARRPRRPRRSSPSASSRSSPRCRRPPARRARARRRSSDLADEPFIVYPVAARAPCVHDAVDATCADHGFSPIVAMEIAETSTLVSFVAAGVGVALVPASARQMSVTGAVYRPLAGGAARRRAGDVLARRRAGRRRSRARSR